ncbi:MAG: hypothetical protein ACEQSR_13120 [Candidatus Methylacidiphilales bacterium]
MKFAQLVQLKFCLLLSLLVVSIAVNANEIDGLITDKQVLALIKKLSPKDERIAETSFEARYSYDKKTQKTADSLGVKNWVKIDFDKNGETDLIAFNLSRFELVVVLCFNGKYVILYPSNSGIRYHLVYPLVKRNKHKNLILIYHQEEIIKRPSYIDDEIFYSLLECDTIHYDNGMFLNYYKDLEKHTIESISIKSTNNDVGGEMNMEIDFINLKDSCFKLEGYRELAEKYTYKLTNKEILRVKYLLEKSNFKKLNDNLKYGIEHYQHYQIEIIFDNGKVTKIEDKEVL